MPKGTVQFKNSQVGSIAFEIEHIGVRGGPDFPILTFLADVNLCAYTYFRMQAPTIHPLSLVRVTSEFCCQQQRVIARSHTDIGLFATDPQVPVTAQVRFEFPLDLRAVTIIERGRSGNLQSLLKITPLFAMHDQKEKGNAVNLFQLGHIQDISFAIPKSQWIETLLPQVGYGGLELIEIRFNTNTISRKLPESLTEIQEAKRDLLEGNWGNAVGHCRKALELILQSATLSVPTTSRFKDKVNDFISNNFSSLAEKQSKLLAEQMSLIWEVSSQVAHPSATVFTRADAEFIVRVTTDLLEYVSRLLS